MLFRRLILASVLMGLVIGAGLGTVQHFTTVQLIVHAEQYEHPDPAEEMAWEPADGWERTVFTYIADACVAIGFALILMVVMSAFGYWRTMPMGPGIGILWGLAAFAAFFVAPAFGLSPEVPGTHAAALTPRQIWWVATVLLAAIALALVFFAPGWKKLPAVLLVAIPYLIGAPQPDVAPLAGHSPDEIAALTHIHYQFIWATGGVNLLLWLALGAVAGWVLKRWIWPELPAQRHGA